jgi:O-antigen/teichoic acid export membrane protein
MKLLKHLAGYLPVNIASGIASFGAVYVFTRLMSAEDYGIYALMVWGLYAVHTFSLTWVEAANYRFTGQAEVSGGLPGHYRTALSLMMRSILLALAITAVLAVLLRNDPRYLAILPWFAALLPLNTIIQMALEAHKAGQRVGRYAFVATFQLLAGFGFGALLCWTLGMGAVSAFMGLVFASLLMAMKEGPWLLQQARGGVIPKGQRAAWLGYGAPIAAALVLDLIISGIDRPMIAALLPDGEAAVGAYAAGYGVADKTVLLLCAWAAMAGSPLVMAAYERGGQDAAREEARGLVTTLLLIGMPAATGLALVARPLAEAMIGEAVRAQAMEIIPLIAFAGLLNGLLIHYFSEAFQLAKKTGQRAALMLVPAGLNVGLNFWLLPQFGLMGAVYATVASYIVGIVLLALVGRRYVRLPLPPLELLKVALACAAMWPVILVLPDWGSWPELFAKVVSGGAIYISVALALNAGGARAFMRDRLKASKPATGA